MGILRQAQEEAIGKVEEQAPAKRRGGRPRRLTAEQEAEVVRLARGGMAYRKVGKRFGVSKPTVADVLKRHGSRKKDDPEAVDPRRALPLSERDDDYRAPGSKLTEGEWRALLGRRLAGESDQALALEAGVSTAAIFDAAAERDLRKGDVPGAVYRWRSCDGAPEGFAKLGFVFDPADPAGALTELGQLAAVAAAEGRDGDYTRVLRLIRATRGLVGRGEAEAAANRNGGRNPGEPHRLHAAQVPPEGSWATWLFLGGRGAGKTLAGARWLHSRAMAKDGALLAMVGATRADVREVMVEGPAGVRSLSGAVRPRWEAGRQRLVWPNGSEAHAFSADAPERLRGPQFEAAWADEFCAWGGEPGTTLAMLRMGLRLGEDPRLVVTSTPKPIPALRALAAEGSCVRTDAATAVNAGNLAPAFLETLTGLYGGTSLAAQELEGLILEDAEGALWKRAELLRCRGALPSGRLERVVVAVDPPAGVGSSTGSGRGALSGSSGATSPRGGGSACGIVAAGKSEGRYYVLGDRSLTAAPGQWAQAVAAAVGEFGAETVTAEANQGGEMVRSVLRNAGVTARVELRHARLSKRERAQPVAALYEQGKVTHCGAFPLLEEEMCGLGSGAGLADRVDAPVWALTELSRGGEGPRIRVL